ncbi:DNA-binding protein, partial [Burkholderia pseudomallei]
AFLLDHPVEVAVSSMRKVAQRSNLQPASIVRLAQQFCFPGWNELRELFVARVRKRPQPLPQRASWPVTANANPSLAAAQLAAARNKLQAS